MLLAGSLCLVAAGFVETASAVGGSVFAWGYNSFGECNVPSGLNDAVAVECGNYFSMALRANGTITTWGDDGFGLKTVPAAATNVIAISSRGYDCLALRNDGSLVAWGAWGSSPEVPVAATGIVAIATGGGHHLALREDGELLAWGANNYGQCNIPLAATNVVAIGAGYTHSLVLRKDGRLVAWGENLGGTTDIPLEATNIIAISCGPDFNLALRSDGRVVAWGLDWGGNLDVPVAATNIVAVAAGEMPEFAIRSNGSVLAWGRGDNGELNVPGGLAPAFLIGAGNYHSLGIRVVGGVSLLRQPTSREVSAGDSVLFNVPAIGQVPVAYQWRFNGVPMSGETSPALLLPGVQTTNAGNYDLVVQNGFGAVTSQVASVTVLPASPTITLPPTSQAVSVGGSTSFSVRAKGTLPLNYQWQINGTNLVGETNTTLVLSNAQMANSGAYDVVVTNGLGSITSVVARLEVVPVFAWGTNNSGVLDLPFGLTNVVALAAGQSHNLALKADGTVIGWGENSYGQCVAPQEVTNIQAVAAGGQFSLVLRQNGTVHAWGSSGTWTLPDATNIVAIAAAPGYVNLLKSDGTLFDWPWADRPTPPTYATNLVAIAAGRWHSLGLRADGVVLGWGNNSYGQAAPPLWATNVITLAAGDFFSLGLRADGAPFAWGNNSYGQTNIPPEATNILFISAGSDHAVAVREDGRTFVWGNTNSGQGIVPAALTFPTAIAAGNVHDLALLGTGQLRFVRQPMSQATLAGNSIFLSAAPAGSGPISYQWMYNGTNLPGATHAYLTVPGSQSANAGDYSVIISNTQGACTSLVASVTVIPSAPVISVAPECQLVFPGGDATFAVLAHGSEPLNYQWRLNGRDLPGATNATLMVTNAALAQTGAYEVRVSNHLGSISAIATLTFQPTVDDFDLGVSGPVLALARQADGKIVVGGGFTLFSGLTRSSLARLNRDGTLDLDFDPKVVGGVVNCLAIEPDGRILLAGRFTSIAGQFRTNLARLNPDGSLDRFFKPMVDGLSLEAMTMQPDGHILIGGTFTKVNGQTRTNFARLNSNGDLDATFNPRPNGTVNTIALQADNGILVGGNFSTLGGQPRSRIGRLNPDGSLDDAFTSGTPGSINCIAVQADGRILLGGTFSQVAGQARSYIARLMPDGALDESFNPGSDGRVLSMSLQTDGKILVGGYFTSLAGESRNYLGRLNANGSLDAGFNPGANSSVLALTVLPDGRIMAGGNFTNFGGQPRSRLAAAVNPDSETDAVSYDGSRISWLRSGGGTEIWRATFEASTNGTSWLPLGAATRTASGWESGNVILPDSATIRARGYAADGYHNGSSWFVERGCGSPAITSQPVSRTNIFGTSAQFTVVAAGSLPLSYLWRCDGTDLQDSGNVVGSGSPTLTLGNVSAANRGCYSVVISNSLGSITSTIVALSVAEPVITLNPVSQLTNAGQTVTFTAAAAGTPPLALQWRKNGTAVSGATAPSLMLTNVQWADAGNYDLLASNISGTAISKLASLAFPAGVDQFNPSANGSVYAVALQPDGKILAGGDFTTLGGGARRYLARLRQDGTVDSSFGANVNNSVMAISLLPDGEILIGGNFTSVGGLTHNSLARLTSNGDADHPFNSGIRGIVYSLCTQNDGRILVGGSFTNSVGEPASGIVRLNSDGTLDTAFAATTFDAVYAIGLQTDGRILVGGAFTNLCGQSRAYLGRLNSDGTLDPTFAGTANNQVLAIAMQTDGSILVGGKFTVLGEESHPYIGRLRPDGSADGGFTALANNQINTIAQQADGRIIVGGLFTSLGGVSRAYLGRLDPDGALDRTFVVSGGWSINALAVQPDGGVIAGGSFTTFAGQARSGLARLTNSYPAFQELALDGSNVTWRRGAASPEVRNVLFDVCTNGMDWTRLGSGICTPDGWQLNGFVPPPLFTLRARGFTTSGFQNGSSGMIEQSMGLPSISVQPGSRTNNAGSTTGFAAVAAGSPPLTYQWLKNGVPLQNGGNLSGVDAATLVLNNVQAADMGLYQLLVSNAFGTVTSGSARLGVIDPFISVQPANRSVNASSNVTFTVQALGTSPLGYEWWKDGVRLNDGGKVSGARTATLTLSNVFGPEAGNYSVIVSNIAGVSSSQIVTLRVVDPYITSQPASQSIATGQTATFSVGALATLPVTYQWRRDGVDLPGATQSSFVITNAHRGDIGHYHAVLGNAYGISTSAVASLTVNLTSIDALDLGAVDGHVECVVIQPDGKLVLGGTFNMIGGQPHTNLARVNADGTLDGDFAPAIQGNVYCLALQTDGKILAGGSCWINGSLPRTNFARFNSDGTVDATFNPPATQWKATLALQPDGKIVTSGGYGTDRFNSDGSMDTNFIRPGIAANALAIQPGGKIVLAKRSSGNLGRLNPDGTLDASFTGSAGNWVYCLGVQPDGKILVGGDFTTLCGQPRNHMGRLNSDGTLDTGFNPNVDSYVTCLAMQSDGRVVIGGYFSMVGGQARNRIARLEPDGQLDYSFNPGADSQISDLAIQEDGSIVIAGYFSTLAGESRNCLARLANSDPASQNLILNGNTLTWSRTGTSAAFWRTSFEWSTNEINWEMLGEGNAVGSEWQLSALSLPDYASVRARGFVVGSGSSGSGWLVENILLARPRIFSQDGQLGINSGHFGFNFGARPGQRAVIEASTNLQDWTPLATNILSASPVFFSDQDSPNYTRRFYRLRLLQ